VIPYQSLKFTLSTPMNTIREPYVKKSITQELTCLQIQPQSGLVIDRSPRSCAIDSQKAPFEVSHKVSQPYPYLCTITELHLIWRSPLSCKILESYLISAPDTFLNHDTSTLCRHRRCWPWDRCIGRPTLRQNLSGCAPCARHRQVREARARNQRPRRQSHRHQRRRI
jgi:hypothetical protein